jgi:superfamily II DNA or RNA helicase
MNIPNLEFGVMFHSTSELNTIQQVAGRVRRFAENKNFGYLLDFTDVIKIDDGYGESKSKTL